MEGFRRGRLLRIFVDEADRRGIAPLYVGVVDYLRAQGVAGASIFRGIEGYGGHREVHLAKALSWVPNLPIVIEVVDDDETIARILPELERIVGDGLITLEAAEYLQLRRNAPAARPS